MPSGNAGVTGVRRPANFAVLGSERRPESIQRPLKHVEYRQMLDAAGPATALRVRSGLFPKCLDKWQKIYPH